MLVCPQINPSSNIKAFGNLRNIRTCARKSLCYLWYAIEIPLVLWISTHPNEWCQVEKTTKLTNLLIEFSLVFLWRVFPFLGLYRMWCLINFTNRTGTWKLSHFVCCSTPGLQLSSSTLRATHTLPRKYSVGLGRGSFKQVCSNCATCDLPSQFLLYFEYQPRKWVVSREKTNKQTNQPTEFSLVFLLNAREQRRFLYFYYEFNV